MKAANDQEKMSDFDLFIKSFVFSQQAIEFEQSVNGKAKEFAAEIADLKAKLAIAQQTTPRSDNEEVQELSQQVQY